MNADQDRATGRKKPHVEWPTVWLVALCYSVWIGAAFWLYPVSNAAALAVMAVAVALHSSLQHEVLHGHPTRDRRINEALVFLPIGLFYPYRRFRATHLRHHRDARLTDPYDDPESFYRAAFDYERLPGLMKKLLRFNNMLVGRMLTGPALMVGGFIAADFRKAKAGNASVSYAWLLHLAGMIPVVLLLAAAGIPFWLYAVTAAYGGLSLITIRTYAEHQWSERPDGRTIIVERSLLSLLFLNNNLHLVHHKHPSAAWYDLPALYRGKRAVWVGMNGGYVFPGYGALFRAFAFRAKEPVAHPVLRREREPARNFHPGWPQSWPATQIPAVPVDPPKE